MYSFLTLCINFNISQTTLEPIHELKGNCYSLLHLFCRKLSRMHLRYEGLYNSEAFCLHHKFSWGMMKAVIEVPEYIIEKKMCSSTGIYNS